MTTINGCFICGTDIICKTSREAATKRFCSKKCRFAFSKTLWRKRFFQRINIEDGCWIWKGVITPRGYASFYYQINGVNKIISCHRAAYMDFIGSIPAGLTLDHLCRNKSCVNPSHLEPVTMRENILRSESPPARNHRKVFCQKQHEFSPQNTYVRDDGQRECRICKRAIQTVWRNKRRLERRNKVVKEST